MSRDLNRKNNSRLKYGICLNDECSKSRNKEVQSISYRNEFICSECGKELRECSSPKKSTPKPIIIIILALVLILSGGLYVLLSQDSTPSVIEPEQNQLQEVEIIKDTLIEEPVKIPTPNIKKAPTSNRNLKLSYGNYSGDIKNGYPHGQGKLTYTKARVINRNDMKAREAQTGNYIIGEFYNGFIVYGKLYDASGNLLSTLNFGVSNEDSYESK